jgi:hypothetical protein
MSSEEFDRKSLGLEFLKRATGISSEFGKMKNWNLWRGRPPPTMEKKNQENI